MCFEARTTVRAAENKYLLTNKNGEFNSAVGSLTKCCVLLAKCRAPSEFSYQLYSNIYKPIYSILTKNMFEKAGGILDI